MKKIFILSIAILTLGFSSCTQSVVEDIQNPMIVVSKSMSSSKIHKYRYEISNEATFLTSTFKWEYYTNRNFNVGDTFPECSAKVDTTLIKKDSTLKK